MHGYANDIKGMVRRVAETTGLGPQFQSRQDLRLADYEVKSGDTARLLLQYDRINGQPSLSDVDSHVFSVYGGKLCPVLGSVRTYPDRDALEVTVEQIAERRAADGLSSYVRVAGNVYTDPETQEQVWELRKTDAGQQYLVRKAEESIEQILQERNRLLGRGLGVTRFAELAASRTAGWVQAMEGDVVEFTADGQQLVGVVKTIDDKMATIGVGPKDYTIARQLIGRIKQGGSQHLERLKAQVAPYLGKLYPDYMLNQILERIVGFGVPIREP
jgi:hypothetical protein